MDVAGRPPRRPRSAPSRVGNEEMVDDVRWIRSYVLAEGAGSLGTVCIYQATEPRGDPRARDARRPAGQRDHRGRRHGARASRSASRRA